MDRCGGHARQGELRQRVLCGHRRDSEHTYEHRHRAVRIGEGSLHDPESETRGQEGGLQDEERLPRFVASPFERADSSVTAPSTTTNTGPTESGPTS